MTTSTEIPLKRLQPELPTTGTRDAENAVDAVPPPGRLALLGLQHVLVMYAGAVAVPLIVGRALMLSPAETGLLISADLFACGIATLLQTLGVPGIGIRLPIMMGVTFASVAPMLAIIEAGQQAGQPGNETLAFIYGAVIVAGICGFVLAPFISRLARLFPPVVTGTVILVIGISLVRIGIDWAAGGRATAPDYGAPVHLAVAGLVLVAILALMKYTRGLVRSSAILIGVAIGCLVAAALGLTDFGAVGTAPWLRVVLPLQFGPPRFDAAAAVSMCLVMIVVMIESFGMFLAVGTIVERPASRADLTRGLRADAVGTLIGGFFNTFPYTSFSQNVGLISVTGIRSRHVCAAGGIIMLLLGLSPKLAATMASVPAFVLGGAGLVMFGMIAATGIRILAGVDYVRNRDNQLVVAVSLGVGMIPLVSEKFFQFAPAVLSPLLHSGILLATVSAVGLNVFLNGLHPRAPDGHSDVPAAHIRTAAPGDRSSEAA